VGNKERHEGRTSLFLNLYYLADPCFRNHNFSDFWNESGYAPVTQEPEWRIEGYIHASYQPDSQRPERFNGFPPDFDPILELPRFLRQIVKTQNSLNGELSHGVVSTKVHS